MARLHLFEWEDQPWLPPTLRDFITHHLQFTFSAPATEPLREAVANILVPPLKRTGAGGRARGGATTRDVDANIFGRRTGKLNAHSLGHTQWGGSLVIADLDKRVCCAFVMNKMGEGTTGDLRAFQMIMPVYQALAASCAPDRPRPRTR